MIGNVIFYVEVVTHFLVPLSLDMLRLRLKATWKDNKNLLYQSRLILYHKDNAHFNGIDIKQSIGF